MKTVTRLSLATAALSPLLLAAPAHAEPTGTTYASCAEAIAAHAAPIFSNEPGYSTGLDRDHDGMACDKDLPKGYVKASPASASASASVTPSATSSSFSTPAPTASTSTQTTSPTSTGPAIQTDHVTSESSDLPALALGAAGIGAVGFGALRLRRSS